MIKQAGTAGLTILWLALVDKVESKGQKVGSMAGVTGKEEAPVGND